MDELNNGVVAPEMEAAAEEETVVAPEAPEEAADVAPAAAPEEEAVA